MKSNIPIFPEFIPLSLEHKQCIDNYLKLNPPVVSEHNFTELFTWRKAHNTKITKLRDNFCIFMDNEKEKLFFAPFGNNKIQDTIKDLLYWQKGRGVDGAIYGATDATLKEIGDPGQDFIIETDRDNSDYVYCAKDIINLKGKKYDAKRNQINKFKNGCAYEYVRITEPLIKECVEYQERWCAANNCVEGDPLYAENLTIHEMFDNFKNLSIYGGALRINSRIEAFALAGELNPETAVIHAEKANIEFKGIYQAINQLFCEKELSKYKLINREQDVGDAGLRKAKLSYQPHHFVNKYTIKLK